MKNNDKSYNSCQSPIPPHLTPEEKEEWEKELEWQRQEMERRRKEGKYDQKPRKKSLGWKRIRNMFRRRKA
ncbi:hypothetical protein CMI37_09660 [Candidatus Pacearchaeota archaeon]|nr:hypothetical protein [Candidatus Pacearchaeota archaeon]